MEQGKKLLTGVSIYLLAKQVLNIILGAGLGSLIFPVLIVIFLYLRLWKYTPYVAAGLIALNALRYLWGNITGLPGTWLYLTEGILDIGVAGLLIRSQDIQNYFDYRE